MSHSPTKSRQKRSRTGCVNCRRKKKKCDEGKPTCFNCVKTSEKCQWNRPLSFLPQNAFTINEGSDETGITSLTTFPDDHTQSYESEADDAGIGLDDNDGEVGDPAFSPTHPRTRRKATSVNPNEARPRSHPVFSPLGPSQTASMQDTTEQLGATEPAFDNTDEQELPFVPFDDIEPSMDFTRTGSEFVLSPDMLTDDGIFIPGSAYQELHATLRRHVFSTARDQDPSFQTSPSLELNAGSTSIADTANSTTSQPLGSNQQRNDLAEADIILNPSQEYTLWKNWVDEIADWLDKFDKDCHFGRTLPVMAQTCPHLRYSMLALSARQLERKDKSMPPSVALSLYSAAVRLLVSQLPRKDTSVLASCVVICVLEMMSCSPKAWRRHLDGCASLVRSMGIRADSTGVERAIFWCFIRMDVCGGLISKERTLIPTSEWTSQPNFEADVALFSSQLSVDWSAGYSCYLLGCVVEFLFAPSASERTRSVGSPWAQNDSTYSDRWQQLFAIIENWYHTRPPDMLPIITQNASNDHPFPTILLGSGAAIAGNKLHHTAAMLMLQAIPRNVKRRSNHSILWHARRICGIVISNSHHGCWTNSVQPLWIAGQVMSHSTEHKAIIDTYARIERETGWGATWRADDLKQFWGELE